MSHISEREVQHLNLWYVQMYSNLDTNEAEESVIVSEVSSLQMHARVVYLGWEKVSCLEFRSVLIEVPNLGQTIVMCGVL